MAYTGKVLAICRNRSRLRRFPTFYLDHHTTRAIAKGSYFFLFSLINFFQSRNNLKLLVAYAETDPGHLRFQYFTFSTTPLQLMLKAFKFLSIPIFRVQNKPKRLSGAGKNRSRTLITPTLWLDYYTTRAVVATLNCLFSPILFFSV